jgi:hypothetical protein
MAEPRRLRLLSITDTTSAASVASETASRILRWKSFCKHAHQSRRREDFVAFYLRKWPF